MRLTAEGAARVYQRVLAKRSTAGRLYPTVDQAKQVPIQGWSAQRREWGEQDHRARGPVSPLGGTARRA